MKLHSQLKVDKTLIITLRVTIFINELLCLTLANDQLDEQNLVHLLQSSTYTCFEQYLAHPQEVKLY